jgi:transcriptional regulator with XRE-family HTH domain
MVKKSVPDGLAEALRRAIVASGLSQNQIGLKAGMESSRISRFMRGERGLTVEAVDRIGEVLGLRLTLSEATPPEPMPAKKSRASAPRKGRKDRPSADQGKPSRKKKS